MLSSSQICVCNCEQQLQCILLFLLIYYTPEDKKRIRKSSLIVPIAPLHNSVSQSVNVVEKEAFLTLITKILFYFLDCLQPHFSYSGFFFLSHFVGKIKTNQSIIHAKLSRVKLTLNWANQQQFRSQIFSPPGSDPPVKMPFSHVV